jgi:murein L,D-transpeptidase YafK
MGSIRHRLDSLPGVPAGPRNTGVARIARSGAHALTLLPLLLLLPGAAALAGSPGEPQAASRPLADTILVVKSERRLYLMRDGQPVRSFPIALGLSPVGPKRQEYDFRTPEGRYVIDARRPNSRYFRALHVSYPNAEDLKQAAERHVSPGRDIMIHGLPNVLQKPLAYYQTQDWTNGCIALSNDDLLEVWAMVRARVPVEIRP